MISTIFGWLIFLGLCGVGLMVAVWLLQFVLFALFLLGVGILALWEWITKQLDKQTVDNRDEKHD